MPLTARIQSLKTRHAEIETQIHAEETRPSPDKEKLQKLKKEKLTLKDEIKRLEEEAAA